jgi:hypothetical protein
MEITMRRLFLALHIALTALILLNPWTSWGAAYYVDATGGDDGNTGLATDNAWQTISKVNGESFSAGDSILFAKDNTWREQLTVPSSGSAGNPITFGAYGSGAAPIISGADVIGTWTAATVDWAQTFAMTPTGSGNGAEARERRNIIGAASLTNSGTSIRVTFKGGAASGTLGGASIGLGSGVTGDYSAAPTRITFGGDNSYAFTDNEVFVSDEIAFTLDETEDYLLHIHFTNPYSYQIYGGGSSSQWYKNSSASDDTMVEDVTYVNNAFWTSVTKIEVKTELTNVWKATVTTEPSQVYFDGVIGTKIASSALCNGAGEWNWTDNVLYVYSTEDPDGSVTIEAATRSQGIVSVDKSYITFDGIEVRYGNETGSSTWMVAINGGASVTLQSMTIRDNAGKSAVRLYGSGDGKQVLNSEIYNQRYSAPEAAIGNGISIGGGTGKEYLIDNSVIYNIAGDGVVVGYSGADFTDNVTISNNRIYDSSGHGILVYGDGSNPDGTIIELNELYGNGASIADCYQIDLLMVGDNNVVRRNIVHDGGGFVATDAGGLRFDAAYAGPPSPFGTGNEGYYNVIYNEWRGIHVIATQNALNLYNNSIYNTTDTSVLLDGSSATTGVVIKNNIISVAGTRLVLLDDGSTDITLSNNLYYDTDYTDKWYLDGAGASSTLAAWQTATSQDNNSLAVDPLFVSTVTPDFHLRSSSPAINAGVDVGLTADYRGMVVPQGSAPDIGAYEFGPGDPGFLKGTYRGTMGIHWMW